MLFPFEGLLEESKVEKIFLEDSRKEYSVFNQTAGSTSNFGLTV